MNYYEPITEIDLLNQKESYKEQIDETLSNRRKKLQDNKHKRALKETREATKNRQTMLNAIKKDIKVFPLEQCSKKDYSSWIFPQILAHFGSKKLFFKDGFVSPTLTLQNWDLDPLESYWLDLITSSPRSNFLESSKNPSLSQAVPLALSAFKTYQDLSYENWDFRDYNITHFLEPLHREVLSLRTQNLPDPQTLDWKNLEKKLDSWFSFGEWEAHTLGNLPRLAKHIFTQTWLWHPTKLHSLAIQSLKNWDHAEKSIHNSTIFV